MSLPLIYLSDRRALFIGTPVASRRLELAASRLIVCLKGELHYQVLGQQASATCSSLLLPVGLPVRIDSSQAVIADCYLDVTGFDYAVLRQQAHRCEQGIYSQLRDEERLRQTLLQLRDSDASAAELWSSLEPLLNPPDLVQSMEFYCDPRVEQVIARIKRTARENLSLEELAGSVGLSSSRLLSLFKQYVGIPIRRYRLWRRLHQATTLLAGGCSLTEAALSSGFSDSPHFSRTFMDLLGFQPSLLIRSHCVVKTLVTPAKNAQREKDATSPELAASSYK